MSSAPERLPFAEQIERNGRLATRVVADLKASPERLDRVAARHLFSILAHLERIAVLAAERGGGIEGQLDDERAHLMTFESIAAQLGGVMPAPLCVQGLTEFLGRLSSEESLACLNVVCEAWLENIFTEVGDVTPSSSAWAELFRVIGSEEARHSREALAAAKIDPDRARPLVRIVEELLWRISIDPHFMWPLAWFKPVQSLGRMGQRAIRAHKRALAALSVEPGTYLDAMATCGREGLNDLAPRPIKKNEWELTAFEAELQPIRCSFEFRWRRPALQNEAELEAAVVRAVGKALAEIPRLNRIIVPQRQELWQGVEPIVGVRRLYDRAGQVMTIYARAPELVDTFAVSERLAIAASKARALPYLAPPKLSRELLALAPPSRAAATVTNMLGQFPPGTDGYASLAPLEGATWAVCVCSARRSWGRQYFRISIEADHRAHNGRELGLFATALKAHLES
jgi:hypothetical protein